ncbi:MAG: exo-alpha-sialidase [Treponema sp.]|nr:exo-alpha-sialidase [Treponema sp.]
MKKIAFLLAGVFCTALAFSQPFSVADGLFNQSDKNTLGLSYPDGIETFTVFDAQEKGDHFCNGAVLASFKGVLYCQWQSSAKDEDAPDTKVVYAVSTDDGKTWSEPKVLAKSPKRGYRSSGGWHVTEDSLIAYINEWTEGLTPRGGFTYYTASKDGKKWSKLKPVKMADGSVMNGIFEQDPHALPDGRIIGAAHFQKGLYVCPIYTDNPSGTDGWKKGAFVSRNTGSTSVEMEPSWFTNSDATLVMVFRDQNSSFVKLAATSTDRGETWSQVVATTMPDARTKQSAGNLPDGTAFFVGNPVSDTFRSPLALTLSTDGKHFDKAYLLRATSELPEIKYEGKAKRKGYHYPKSLVTDRYLYTAYTTGKELVQITRIPLCTFQ